MEGFTPLKYENVGTAQQMRWECSWNRLLLMRGLKVLKVFSLRQYSKQNNNSVSKWSIASFWVAIKAECSEGTKAEYPRSNLMSLIDGPAFQSPFSVSARANSFCKIPPVWLNCDNSPNYMNLDSKTKTSRFFKLFPCLLTQGLRNSLTASMCCGLFINHMTGLLFPLLLVRMVLHSAMWTERP